MEKKAKLGVFLFVSVVLSAVLVGSFFLLLDKPPACLGPAEKASGKFGILHSSAKGPPVKGKGQGGEKGTEGSLKRRKTGLGLKEAGSVLHARPLEVDLFFLKGKKEVPAPWGKIYVHPLRSWSLWGSWGGGKRGACEREGAPSSSGWVFPCDGRGKAFLPLTSLVRDGGGGGVDFLVWAQSSNGLYSTPKFRLKVDDFGRYFLSGSYPKVYLGHLWKLRLFPNATVVVVVKNESGKVVEGIPVGLFRPSCPLGVPGARAGLFLLRSGRSGKDGKCLFRLPVEKGKSDWAWMILNVFAGFNFPLSHLDRWFKRVEVGKHRNQEVVLVVPPTGKVSVEVEGWEKIPKKGKKFWVWLGERAHAGKLESKLRNLFPSKDFFVKEDCREVENGRVVFPFVEVGIKLTAFGFEEGRWGVSKEEASGPSFPGEEVTVLLTRPRENPVVSGILLGPKERPFRNGRILVYEGRKGEDLKVDFFPSSLISSFKTDSAGRFHVPLPPDGRDSKIPLAKLRISPQCVLGEKWPPFWIVPLPSPFSSGDRFLGTFRVQVPRLLARGVVLDWRGRPVEGAEVRCYRPFVRSGKEGWERVYSATGVSDRVGRWFVKGFWRWSRLKVMAIKEGAGSSERVLVGPGARGLKLVLSGGGGVEAEVLVSKKIYLERRMLDVQLVPREAWVRGSNGRARKKVFPGGRVVWRNLLPGIYDFRVCAQGDPEKPLVQVSGIRVEPGKMCRDPRIQGVDLRGLVEEFLVIAEDPSGKVLDPAHMWIKSKAGVGAALDPSGKGLVVLRRIGDVPEMEVVYPGYKSRRIRGKGKVVVVTLEPIPKRR